MRTGGEGLESFHDFYVPSAPKRSGTTVGREIQFSTHQIIFHTTRTRREEKKSNSPKPFASKMKSRALLIPVPRIGPAAPALFSYSRRI